MVDAVSETKDEKGFLDKCEDFMGTTYDKEIGRFDPIDMSQIIDNKLLCSYLLELKVKLKEN